MVLLRDGCTFQEAEEAFEAAGIPRRPWHPRMLWRNLVEYLRMQQASPEPGEEKEKL